MLKQIDRYIIRKFLGTFFFTITLLLLISVVFDVSERVDDFMENHAPFKAIVFEYYVNFMLFYGNLFSSLIIFLAVIIFTSKMASNTEIVAILSSGVSFNRMLRPYFVAATLLAIMSLLMNHWVIPFTNQTRLDFTYKYLEDPPSSRFKNLHRQISPGKYIYFENYNSNRQVGYQFTMETFKDHKLTEKVKADYLRWDKEKDLWHMEKYVIRKIDAEGQETLLHGVNIDTTLSFNPEDLIDLGVWVETMNYVELRDFIAREKVRGAEDVHFYEVEMHQRTSYPFSTYILTVIGASIAARKRRGGIGLHLANGLGLVVIYILFMRVSTTFATNGNLDPLISVWIPNLIFGALALFFYSRVQK